MKSLSTKLVIIFGWYIFLYLTYLFYKRVVGVNLVEMMKKNLKKSIINSIGEIVIWIGLLLIFPIAFLSEWTWLIYLHIGSWVLGFILMDIGNWRLRLKRYKVDNSEVT